MKNLTSTILAVGFLSVSCGSKTITEEVVQAPKVPVEITTIGSGLVNDNLELFATAAYLQTSLVTAPIASFIIKVHARIGDRIQQGQLLFELESKERRALGNMPVKYDSSLAGYGKINVKASASGIITTVDQQPGSYIMEGTTLCTITQTSGMVFQVSVPFEYVKYVRSGNNCTIVLPDSTRHSAVFTKPLVGMNANAQTQTMLARTSDNLILPEGLIAKVLVSKGSNNNTPVLPNACVLSDEMMQSFWVMKLINDSTAIKVPVKTGNRNKEEVEILSPQFVNNDRIVSNGNYGLADTALVKISAKK